MLFRYPDTPLRISLERLAALDKEPAGFWFAQAKLDGWRHVAMKTGPATWAHYSKRGKPSAIEPSLRAEFEALPWALPIGWGLDCELLGPRHAGTKHTLHVFDVVGTRSSFKARLEALEECRTLGCESARVKIMPHARNPGLVDFFAQQLTNPFSEGLVVRTATQTNLGSYVAPTDNPQMLKVKMADYRKEG